MAKSINNKKNGKAKNNIEELKEAVNNAQDNLLANRQLYANDEATVDDFNDLKDWDSEDLQEFDPEAISDLDIFLYQNKEIANKIEKMENEVFYLKERDKAVGKSIDKLENNLDHHRYETHDKAVKGLKNDLKKLESQVKVDFVGVYNAIEQIRLGADLTQKERALVELCTEIADSCAEQFRAEIVERFNAFSDRLDELESKQSCDSSQLKFDHTENSKEVGELRDRINALETKLVSLSSAQKQQNAHWEKLKNHLFMIFGAVGLIFLIVVSSKVVEKIRENNERILSDGITFREAPAQIERFDPTPVRKVTFSDLEEISEELAKFKADQEVLNRDFAHAVGFVNGVKNLIIDEIAVEEALKEPVNADEEDSITEDEEKADSKGEVREFLPAPNQEEAVEIETEESEV